MTSTNLIQQFYQILPKLLVFPNWKFISLEAVDDTHTLIAKVKIQGTTHSLKFEIKSRFHSSHIKPDSQTISLYSHLKPYEAKKLIESGQSYLDSASNTYLTFEGVYVYLQSNQAPLVEAYSDYIHGDVFNPTTTSLLTCLILEPTLLERPYREIALCAKISLGSVKKSLDILDSVGVVENAGTFGKEMILKEAIWKKWASSYGQKLLPKRSLGRFTQVDASKGLKLKVNEGCVGGMEASTKLGFGLEGSKKRIYLYVNMSDFIRRNKLRSDPEGEVQIYQASWDKSQESKPQCAPVSIVYADLLSMNNPRCDEIADEIFQSKLLN